MMFEDYYKILGVMPGASREEIKRAYHIKAKHCHPDLNPSLSGKEFIKVKRAFDYLMNGTGSMKSGNQSYATYSYTRKKQYEDPEYFNWESYRKWQENMYQKYHQHKKDINFKSTLFGKIFYYTFHLVFFVMGLYIIIMPTLSVIADGFDKDQNIFVSVFSIIGASIFGIIMVVMIILSGFSLNVFKRL